MKILLINPPVFNDFGRVLTTTPPLGLMYLASYLEKNDYTDVKVIDADVAKLSWLDLENLLIKENPDVVGITASSFILPAMFKTAEIARQTLQDSIIVTGGYGPTKEPEKILRSVNQAINFVVMGEGEITFLELIKQLDLDKGVENFNDINGLAYLDKAKNLVVTPPREYIKNLDSVPWPAYHLLFPDFSKYHGMAFLKKERSPSVTMFASRGCPHRCAFCSLGSKMYRQRGPKDVVAEMEFYLKKFGVRAIQLYDDEFVGMSYQQNKWVEEICEEIIRRGLQEHLIIVVQGRCSEYIELETLKKMREAGIAWVWWGVESGSQKILDSIKKDIKVENILRDFDLAKKAGIKNLMFIMVGFPGETPADINLTAKIIKKAKPDVVRAHILSPYPGSELRKYLEENNLLETDEYYKYDSQFTVIHHTNEMSAKEIKKYYDMLVFRFVSGYWYFAKFLIKSLMTKKGWKKLFGRIKVALSHFWSWNNIGK
jgi:magnesium-protoporphyrin IX monomethyl ester (oxidative) cyclase